MSDEATEVSDGYADMSYVIRKFFAVHWGSTIFQVGYTMDTMYFEPMENDVEVSEDLQLPQFSLKNHKVIDCSMNYTTGAYPCLEIRFKLVRDLGYYLIQVYVPSILIVILSWVSFWINVESSPARVTIGLLTVLTATTMSNGARASLPRVSYIKAIDVWMIVCLTFVFSSLIEYALVNVLARKPARPATTNNDTDVKFIPPSQHNVEVSADVAKVTSFWSPAASGAGSAHHRASSSTLRTTLRMTSSSSSSSSAGGTAAGIATDGVASGRPRSSSAPNSAAVAAAPKAVRDGKYNASRVDKMSRKMFPTVFIVFNAVYWCFYMFTATISLDADDD